MKICWSDKLNDYLFIGVFNDARKEEGHVLKYLGGYDFYWLYIDTRPVFLNDLELMAEVINA